MNMFFAILPVSFLSIVPLAAQPNEGCIIRVTESGNFVTLQGVLDAKSWSEGRYDLTVESRQGSNRSLSRQAGAFDGSAQTSEGTLVLSAARVYVVDGGELTATLIIHDGTRSASCELQFER